MKHHVAITQSPIAMPAGLPKIRNSSLLARDRQAKAPARIGANCAPISHMRYDARITLHAVNASHSKCAGPNGKIANGRVMGKAVGK